VAELDRFEALSFDCYGTMIDWEAGITRELRAWLAGDGRAVGDDELLGRFAEVETVIEAQHPTMRYPDVLAEALRRIGALLGVPVDDATADRFGESVGRWPAFDDSDEALARLSTKYLLIVVSNVDRASFARSNERLGVGFDLVITAEDVGAYKPADANFEALLAGAARLGAAPDRLLHVAQSLYHDHEPAHRHGLATAWIDRRHDRAGHGATPPPRAGSVAPDWRFTSLRELADAAVGTNGSAGPTR
jgi:2-haloacid dehalogenase